MSKILLIARHEFKHIVLRRRFIGVLLMPLFVIGLATVIGYITASMIGRFESGAVGYVDPDGLLSQAVNPPNADFIFTPFDDEASAQAALQRQEIKAYLTLAPDFLSSGDVQLFYWEDEPSHSDVRRAFAHYRNTQLLADRPPELARRVLDGSALTLETPDRSRVTHADDFPKFILPLVFSVLFIIALFGGGQYLMQAVLDEKENRTMEVMVTSVTPTQLMAGKVLGLGAVGMLQMIVWLVAATIALAVLRTRLPFLQGVRPELDFIVLALVLFALQYLLLGALMAAVGSMVVDIQQGQNYAAPFSLIAMIPFLFLTVILFDPNGVLSVLLSLLPLTSPLALLVRYGMVQVPLWQVVLAVALLAVSAAGAMWLAGRIFRIGMLRFDKGVRWSEVAASIRF